MNKNRLLALAVIAVAFVLRLYFIFHCTAYHDSIRFDMGAYWNGAWERLHGQTHSINQYGMFPPFYIYVLTEILRVLSLMHLTLHALDMTIVLNTLFFCASAYAVYLLLEKLLVHQALRWAGLLIFSFDYPSTYINALVLADNLAIPAMIIATALILLDQRRRSRLGAGLLLGIAIAAKPSLIFLSIPFVLFIFTSTPRGRRLMMITIFVAGLIAAPIASMVENYRISDGKLVGLGSAGGVLFFMGWDFVERLEATFPDGSAWWIDSSCSNDEIRCETIKTKEPFYHQSYYYKLGFEQIADHPGRLLTKCLTFKRLFFDHINPRLIKEPPGDFLLMKLWSLLTFGMFFCTGLLPFYLEKVTYKKEVLFIFSLIFLFLFSIYFMAAAPERRYLYFITFAMIINFFITWDIALRIIQDKYKRS